MKKSNLITGIVFFLAGILFLLPALFTDTRLDSLFFGLASAGMASGLVMIGKYFYWNRPENRTRYQEKLENERIEIKDELKVKIRDKSGRYTYLAGLLAICLSILAFFILGKYELIPEPRMIILFLGGYLVFQIAAFNIFYRHLIKSL